jgi:hypothetical protein
VQRATVTAQNQLLPHMSSSRAYEIKFQLKQGSATQTMVIQATDSHTARKIFMQQNPGCIIRSVSEVKR